MSAGDRELIVVGDTNASLRDCIVATGREMETRGLVVGTSGNVSGRVSADRMLITPSRTSYADMQAEDLIEVDLYSSGDPRASLEWAMHAAIYRRRPDVGGVVHTHSPRATAWSFLEEPLSPQIEENRYYRVGQVATARCAPSGTTALAEAATNAVGTGRAALLARHGVIAVGTDPADALLIARAVERQAEIAWLVRGIVP